MSGADPSRASDAGNAGDAGGATGPGEAFRILFVCAGNTCRSPLAEALARQALARLGWSHVEVRSAGVAALPGEPASDGSLRAAARHGLDLASHRSAQLSEELVRQADLILTMSPRHLIRVKAFPEGEEKSTLLTTFAEGRDRDGESGAGVRDPFGGGDDLYEGTFLQLRELVERSLKRLAPLVSP